MEGSLVGRVNPSWTLAEHGPGWGERSHRKLACRKWHRVQSRSGLGVDQCTIWEANLQPLSHPGLPSPFSHTSENTEGFGAECVCPKLPPGGPSGRQVSTRRGQNSKAVREERRGPIQETRRRQMGQDVTSGWTGSGGGNWSQQLVTKQNTRQS